MTRVEQKCLLASAGTHFVLLLLLFSAPWLLISKRKALNEQILTFLPSFAVDSSKISGGSPTVTQAPAPLPSAPTPQPVAQAEPPPATPKTIEPPSKVEAPKPETIEESAKKPKKADPKPELAETSKKAKNSDFKPSFVESDSSQKNKKDNATASAKAQEQARARAAQQAFAAKISQSLKALGVGLSTGTSIEVPGPGGAAFADYRLIVEAMYMHAWVVPQEVDDESAVVRAKIVIRRDGTVISATIVKPSNNRAVNRSVDRALELKKIQPFPEDSKDSERLFYLNFDLKTKRLFG